MAGIDPTDIIRKFKSELDERLEALSEGVLVLEGDPDDTGALAALFREAHTIKGTAKMLDLHDVNRLAHRMEDLFGLFGEKKSSLTSDHADLLLRCIDQLAASLNAAAQGEPANSSSDQIDRLCEQLSVAMGAQGASPAASPPQQHPAAAPLPTDEFPPEDSAGDDTALPAAPPAAAAQARSAPAPTGAQASGPTRETPKPTIPDAGSGDARIRVAAEKLDRLVKLSSVLTTAMTHADTLLAEFKALKLLGKESARSFRALGSRRQTTGTGGETQLERMSEQLPRLFAATTSLYRDYESHTRELQQLIAQLGHQVNDARMVPVRTLFAGVQRPMRDLAREHGKTAALQMTGEDTEVDKRVIEELRGPLMHLLRNSIDHGIEDPATRSNAGKHEEGTISLSAYHRGDYAVVSVEDDGKGLDPDRLREVAVRRRLMSQEDAARLSDEDCLYLVFMPGFSTSQMITDVSGRGVGLDAVKSSLDNLDGRISVESELGRWTRISLEIPLVLSIVRCLVFRVGQQLLALPTISVERIVRFSRHEVETVANVSAIEVDGVAVDLTDAGELFRAGQAAVADNASIALVVHEMGQRVAFPVDALVIEENLVISPLGPVFSDLPGLGGAAILGSGEVAIVLQAKGLLGLSSRRTARTGDAAGQPQRDRVVSVLVVDDSLNSRELVRSVLEAAGHRVTVAVDGVDGLERARTEEFDLVVTDVEMPQMNGFELTSKLREETTYARKPIIVMTTLDSAAHKKQGLEAGASAYITKGSFDQDSFLDTVARLLG